MQNHRRDDYCLYRRHGTNSVYKFTPSDQGSSPNNVGGKYMWSNKERFLNFDKHRGSMSTYFNDGRRRVGMVHRMKSNALAHSSLSTTRSSHPDIGPNVISYKYINHKKHLEKHRDNRSSTGSNNFQKKHNNYIFYNKNSSAAFQFKRHRGQRRDSTSRSRRRSRSQERVRSMRTHSLSCSKTRSQSRHRASCIKGDQKLSNKSSDSELVAANRMKSNIRRNGLTDPEYLEDFSTDTMIITDADASFILGKGGRTKRKLSRACGAELFVKQSCGKTVLEIRGTSATVEKAKVYVKYVMQQRHGPVALNCTEKDRDDLTVMEVPHECVGYVTGTKGKGLRSLEDEWGILMFFSDLETNKPHETEKLAIFGEERARRSAQLKVMSAVEQKMPGYYSSYDPKRLCRNSNKVDDDDFSTETMLISEEDFSYALGREGATRKKLAKASGGILEYVGRMAYIAGTRLQRERARQYLMWLCAQRTSYVHVDITGRSDCTALTVPSECISHVTGTRGQALRRVEEATSTFIFVNGDIKSGCPTERILIFGENEDNRLKAKTLLENKVHERLTFNRRMRMRDRYCSPSRDTFDDRRDYSMIHDIDERYKDRTDYRSRGRQKADSQVHGDKRRRYVSRSSDLSSINSSTERRHNLFKKRLHCHERKNLEYESKLVFNDNRYCSHDYIRRKNSKSKHSDSGSYERDFHRSGFYIPSL